ncbi:MAG: tetratricopeptide repeat protein [Smithellaceae bacterium]|jgi:tetratricopeptide (TPR) repeat protein
MKEDYSKIIIFVVCLVFLFSAAATKVGAVPTQEDQIRLYLKQGIEKAFNLDNQNANIYLQKALELDKENPTGYAYMAMVCFFSYEMSFEPKDRDRNQEFMLRNISEAITKGEKRIEKNSKDGQAYFAVALAKIVKVHWAIHQKKYFLIAQEASNIWDCLEKAKEGDPQNYDVYFLMGLLHYHIDYLPGFTRMLSSVLITPGDKKKGLQELELAAQKGYLLKELAQSELTSGYLNFEKTPAKALPFAQELKEKFPNNYNFLFALANILSELRRFEEAFDIAREIERGIQRGIPPFVSQLQPRYNQLMGRILFTQGEYDRAREYFQKALKDTSLYNARVRVLAFLRIGMIHDARKEREQAEEYYSKALEVEGGEGTAQIEAKKYLNTPYVPPTKP